MLSPGDKLVGMVGQSMGGPKIRQNYALQVPFSTNVAWSASGSVIAPVTGLCTAWVWSAANQAGGLSAAGGAAMKSFAVNKGDAISWNCASNGDLAMLVNGARMGFGATGPSGPSTAGAGYGGDINRTGGIVSSNLSGRSPDFSDTYLVIGNLGDGSLWRGGSGGVERTSGTGGGGGGATPGGGGGDTMDTGPTYYAGGQGRVILVFMGQL